MRLRIPTLKLTRSIPKILALSTLRGGGDASSLDLERVAFRLEGMECYPLVTALFMGAALALLDFTPAKLHPVKCCKEDKRKLIETIATYAFQNLCMYAVLSSAFVTVVFTLTTLYCKTAIGLGSDPNYLRFLALSTNIRVGAFRAFVSGGYAFVSSLFLSSFLCCEEDKRHWVAFSAIPLLFAIKYGLSLHELITIARALLFATESK